MSVPINIEVYGIGTLSGVIMRYICPISADAIHDKIPFTMRGRFNFGAKKYWMLPNIGIKKGPNLTKSTPDVKKGDIIYNPKTDELIFVLEKLTMPNKVNKIGEIKSNLEIILQARNGLNTKIS